MEKRTGSRIDKGINGKSNIDDVQQLIEEVYELPRGSVKLIYPDRRMAYPSSTIEAFKKHWD